MSTLQQRKSATDRDAARSFAKEIGLGLIVGGAFLALLFFGFDLATAPIEQFVGVDPASTP